MSTEHPPEIHHLTPTDATSSAPPGFTYLPETKHDRKSCTMATLMPPIEEHPLLRRSASCPHSDTAHPPIWSSVATRHSSVHHSQSRSVDFGRLNHIYKEHAGDFWTTIAKKYSGGAHLSPYELELAFLNAQSPSASHSYGAVDNIPPDRPKTAFVSRDMGPSMNKLQHMRSKSDVSAAGKCSVESLLNHA